MIERAVGADANSWWLPK